MQFMARKHRQAPAVIIISLIDILIVLLIFMMITTTFRQVPALKINLPQSTARPKEGSAKKPLMIVTIRAQAPHLYLNTRPIVLPRLQEELSATVAAEGTNAIVAISMDTNAPVQELFDVMSAATAAKIKTQLQVFTKQKGE
jgi:biopolymer transport protein ExbD